MAAKNRRNKFVDSGEGLTIHRPGGKPYKNKKKEKGKDKDKGKKKALLIESDRSALIRLAASLPVGDPDRRVLLAWLKE